MGMQSQLPAVSFKAVQEQSFMLEAGEVVRKRILHAITALAEQGIRSEKIACVAWSKRAL